MSTQCFLLEPTDRYRRSLRRYAFGDSGGKCGRPGSSGYHNAICPLDELDRAELPGGRPVSGDLYPHDQGPWPTSCSCGYQFRPADEWQLSIDRLYRRGDNGELMELRLAPAGAMWYADWMTERRVKPIPGATGTYFGPDGRCLVVRTPAGDWMIDGPSTNGPGWVRTGTPPLVTATPSIWVGSPQTVPPQGYHGFLQAGVLTDPLG